MGTPQKSGMPRTSSQLTRQDEIGEMKRQYNAPELLAKGLPPEFSSFFNYLKSLDYPDEPNYDYLIGYSI